MYTIVVVYEALGLIECDVHNKAHIPHIPLQHMLPWVSQLWHGAATLVSELSTTMSTCSVFNHMSMSICQCQHVSVNMWMSVLQMHLGLGSLFTMWHTILTILHLGLASLVPDEAHLSRV